MGFPANTLHLKDLENDKALLLIKCPYTLHRTQLLHSCGFSNGCRRSAPRQPWTHTPLCPLYHLRTVGTRTAPSSGWASAPPPPLCSYLILQVTASRQGYSLNDELVFQTHTSLHGERDEWDTFITGVDM